MAQKKATKQASNDNGKVCAILSYLLVGIIWYFADESMRKNKFARYHAGQALGLLIVAIIGNILGSIIPIIGWFIILPLVQLFVFVLFIIGIYNAATDKTKPLPLIGSFSESLLK